MILKSNFKCLYKVAGILHVAPGNNVVPDHIGIDLIKTPDFKARVKSGFLHIVRAPDPEKAKEEKRGDEDLISPLAGTPDKKAVEAIYDIQDVNQLRAILELDPRPKVKKAASDKMETIRRAMQADSEKDHEPQET